MQEEWGEGRVKESELKVERGKAYKRITTVPSIQIYGFIAICTV